MIDHVLGRPSTQFRKIQVLTVVSFWSLYLLRGNNHGPPILRSISSKLRLTPWQTMVITLLWLYISRNFAKIMGLECPEPLANLYSRSYFRATWITTGLDAGFWTAMNIRPKWLRDLASIVFALYYLIAAEQADEKVRRVRATLTVEHLRVSWNKSTTPYIAAVNKLMRPKFTKYPPRAIRIPRPPESSYREPVNAWLYFDGPLSALRNQTRIVLDIPGGGFVAMNPRTTDDKLLAWAGKTGVPILSLDYKKAPEYPYPYALNECYDAYHTIVTSRGRCVGLSGKIRPHVTITGDSAGGNLATGLTIMVVQSGSTEIRKWRGEAVLPPPDGLVLVYPALDMNIGSWMTQEQMSLIQDRGMRKTNESVLRRKSEDYYRLTPTASTSQLSISNAQDTSFPKLDYFSHKESSSLKESSKAEKIELLDLASQMGAIAEYQPEQIRTRLAVSSMISYFGDRILTPEMMRAMIILYIGPHNRPDFSTDFFLSPVLAPETILARFPKTYILTGERDPLVDDTVIFAGRIKQAKLHQFRERQELGLEKSKVEFSEKDHVEVDLIPGISHGFLNFPGIFPESWKHIHKCAVWINDLFDRADVEELKKSTSSLVQSTNSRMDLGRSFSKVGYSNGTMRDSRRSSFGESSADEDRPLEMSVGKFTPMRSPPTNGNVNGKTPASFSGKGNITTAEIPSAMAASKVEESNPDNFRLADVPKRKASVGYGKGTQRHRSSLTDHNKPLSFPLSLPLPLLANNQRGKDSDVLEEKEDPWTAKDIGRTVTRLPSEEDLIGRRMDGLAGGLMGLGEGIRTP